MPRRQAGAIAAGRKIVEIGKIGEIGEIGEIGKIGKIIGGMRFRV